MALDDGKSIICAWPLSDVEMAAWRTHPDTFFGVLSQRTTRADGPLDLYDFLSAYRQTPRERLLELLAGARDIAELSQLDQPALASIYAERCVNAAMVAQSGHPDCAQKGVRRQGARPSRRPGSPAATSGECRQYHSSPWILVSSAHADTP